MLQKKPQQQEIQEPKHSPQVLADLGRLHSELLNQHMYSPNRNFPQIPAEAFSIASQVIAIADAHHHFDCFSFAQAVLHSAGYTVPIFPVADEALGPVSLIRAGDLIAEAASKNPAGYFEYYQYHQNIDSQGKFFHGPIQEAISELITETTPLPQGQYLLIARKNPQGPSWHVHGMITVGPTLMGDDLWILHRPSTDKTPQISTLTKTLAFWEDAYSDDRFRARFSICLAPTPDKILKLPNPKQTLIDQAVSLHLRLPSEHANQISPAARHGVEDYLIECTKAAITLGILSAAQAHRDIADLKNIELTERFDIALTKLGL